MVTLDVKQQPNSRWCLLLSSATPSEDVTGGAQVPLVRSRSLMETLWVESVAPEARPVFPPSSLFSLLASVSMATLL